MRFSDPRPRRPRRSLPSVEGLETRELMSATFGQPGPRALCQSGQLAGDPEIRQICSTGLTRPHR